MPSIVNGLFSGRAGISSHGTAIAVVGDNISNASTIGYKSSRSEFEDLIAGGQTAGKVVGSGSGLSAVTTVFEQGSLEFTGRELDLGIDGNGFFVVAEDSQRFYTRAGNFKVNPSGFIVDQGGRSVLGFAAGGSGALQPLNVNTVSQDTVATTAVTIAGNLDASATVIAPASIPAAPAPGSASTAVAWSDLNSVAEFSTVVEIFDALGEKHTMTFFFFRTATDEYTVNAYVDSEDVEAGGTPTGYPRLAGTATLTFAADGTRTTPTVPDMDDLTIDWTGNNASDSVIDITFDPMTNYSASSNIQSITQDGQGIGSVTSLSIGKDGTVTAQLDNGQVAEIGTVGVVNFSNPEGLNRIGNNLLQQSTQSGEPIVGTPGTGTFGKIQSGAIELSTVDIANEFVKLITLQRGFQANSRIITTINQLLNEIIQLA